MGRLPIDCSKQRSFEFFECHHGAPLICCPFFRGAPSKFLSYQKLKRLERPIYTATSTSLLCAGLCHALWDGME